METAGESHAFLYSFGVVGPTPKLGIRQSSSCAFPVGAAVVAAAPIAAAVGNAERGQKARASAYWRPHAP